MAEYSIIEIDVTSEIRLGDPYRVYLQGDLLKIVDTLYVEGKLILTVEYEKAETRLICDPQHGLPTDHMDVYIMYIEPLYQNGYLMEKFKYFASIMVEGKPVILTYMVRKLDNPIYVVPDNTQASHAG